MSTTKAPELALSEAMHELAQATEVHARAVDRLSAARTEQCAAINRLNKAQRAVDTIMETMRKAAPRESDWHSRNRRGEAVPE